MTGQWRIRVTGKQRQKLDVALLVQAVIALSEQFAEDERKQADPQPTSGEPREDDRASSTPEVAS
jgi:hypothetical protein